MPELSEEIQEGGIYLFSSPEGLPPVEVWVGKIETENGSTFAHLQMKARSDTDLPQVGHSPFDLSALIEASGQLVGSDNANRSSFEDGYETWREAFDAGNAGVFAISPANAYWAMLGALDENGVLKK